MKEKTQQIIIHTYSIINSCGMLWFLTSAIYYVGCKIKKPFYNTWISHNIVLFFAVISISFFTTTYVYYYKSMSTKQQIQSCKCSKQNLKIIHLITTSLTLIITIIFVAQFHGNWGPILIPYKNGTVISSYTFFPQTTKIKINNKEYKNYGRIHSFYTDLREFKIQFNQEQEQQIQIPQNIDKFTFISDCHSQTGLQNISDDIIISGGDITNDGTLQDYYSIFKQFKPYQIFLTAMGNHDKRNTNQNIFGFDYEHYKVEFNDTVFYFIQVMNKAIDSKITQEYVNKSTEFLKNNYVKNNKTNILVVHQQPYLKGEYKEYQNYQVEFENWLDQYKFDFVLAGHIHTFQHFKRKNTKIVVGGTYGTNYKQYYVSKYLRGAEFFIKNILGKTYVQFKRDNNNWTFYYNVFNQFNQQLEL